MLAHKHITKLVAAIVAIAVCLCLFAMLFAENISAALGGEGVTMEYESVLFDTDEIMSVNIIMDADEWQDMLDNSTAEVYCKCDVEVNGKMFYSVGIRPKGNTSLTSIASDPTTNRYSFKLEFDQYVDGQTCYGLDKLVLNNNYADATGMKESLIYDMYAFLDADASLYNYASISVNGEYWGIYLALEAVEDSFLLRNYGVRSGELYKPDSMDIGAGMGGERGDADRGNMNFESFDFERTGGFSGDFESLLPSEESEEASDTPSFGGQRPDRGEGPTAGELPNMPNGGDFELSDISGMFGGGGGMGGFSMGGNGSNLNYTDDELDSYSTIWSCEVTNTSTADRKRVVTALKNISEGTDLEDYMDIDNLLKYMAVHIFSVNSDSLSGTMAHNYYLYEENGRLNIIPWDYNLALGGMGGGSDATSTVNEAIDNAFSGTRFFDTLMENEEYHAQYYAYMQKLVDEYLLGDGFEKFYDRVRSQTDALVQSDPNSFFSYEEYLAAVETLHEVVKLRGKSIDGQLNGSIPSTAAEQRSSNALIDASHIDLGVMGSMSMGGGGFGGRGPSESTGNSTEPDETASNESVTVPTVAKSSPTAIEDTNGVYLSSFGGGTPEGFDPSQFGGNMQTGQVSGDNAEGSPNSSGNNGGGFDRNNMPSGSFGGGTSASADGLLTYAICFAVLIAALLFAKLYRRRPRKR